MSQNNRNGQKRSEADELRRKSELRVLEQQAAHTATLSEVEVRALVHELQVYQIELEL